MIIKYYLLKLTDKEISLYELSFIIKWNYISLHMKNILMSFYLNLKVLYFKRYFPVDLMRLYICLKYHFEGNGIIFENKDQENKTNQNLF